MSKPTHLRALELDYDAYIRLNGGEHCGICGNLRKEDGRRLHRDHWHKGPLAGQPRGLLCHRCNRVIWPWVDRDWFLLAIAYFRRSEARDDAYTHMDVGA
jgi:hypothetical protein